MKRDLLYTREFLRAAKRYAKKHPKTALQWQDVLDLLHRDAFDPRLKTHKLSGKLTGSWACSAGYDLRIIFSFIKHKKKETILLETVGSHDEVY